MWKRCINISWMEKMEESGLLPTMVSVLPEKVPGVVFVLFNLMCMVIVMPAALGASVLEPFWVFCYGFICLVTGKAYRF